MKLPDLNPQPWEKHAACQRKPSVADLFFPIRGEDDKVRLAKSICAECPVQAECLAYALAHNIRYGIWGGKSERERRVLRRRLVAANPNRMTLEKAREIRASSLTTVELARMYHLSKDMVHQIRRGERWRESA